MNVSKVNDCYGCGVCAIACSKNAISIVLNKKGFYIPRVDASICNDCNMCSEVCAFLHDDVALLSRKEYSYGGWSNNKSVQSKCSSGGVAFEVGRHLLNNGYKFCGVRYNPINHIAEHYIASNENELEESVGSKYIQSYTYNAFKAINRKDKYIVTGTPCQIDSFRRYIRKFKIEDNFILLDFFCHSVPSLLAWKKYVKFVRKHIGEISSVKWRDKKDGWHDSWAMVFNDNAADLSYMNYQSFRSKLSSRDVFYKLFLGDYCCNPACEHNCKYKFNRSSADIRVGDFWGDTYRNNEKGVSAVIAFTDKGHNVIKASDCSLIEYPINIVAEGQMFKNVGKAKTYKLVDVILKLNTSSLLSLRVIFVIEYLLNLPSKIKRKFKSYR